MSDRETTLTHVAYDTESPIDRGDFFLISTPGTFRYSVMISQGSTADWLVVMHDAYASRDVQRQAVTGPIWSAIDLANEMLGSV